MQGCDHEEADTRIAYMFCPLSIKDTIIQVVIRTVDTDIVVLE